MANLQLIAQGGDIDLLVINGVADTIELEVPDGEIWQILYGSMIASTNSTVATRTFRFHAADSADKVVQSIARRTMSASQNETVEFGRDPFQNDENATEVHMITPLLLMVEGMQLRYQPSNANAADTCDIRLVRIRWKTRGATDAF